MAQWIRHLTTDQGIPGSSPGRVVFFLFFFYTIPVPFAPMQFAEALREFMDKQKMHGFKVRKPRLFEYHL